MLRRCPKKLPRWEKFAIRDLNEFKASFWQRLFGLEKKLRAELEQKVDDARARDVKEDQASLKLHQQKTEEWSATNRMATAIVRGETSFYYKAFEELEPLAEMEEIGCHFKVVFPDECTAQINLSVESEKIVPRDSKSLTRAGKLSVKTIPQGRFYELYQDYACGCAIRTARELFSFLPLTRVIVNVNAMLLDSSTGHMREQTIVSVGIPKPTLETMNFFSVDPSEAMKLFTHRMGFKRSSGFFAVSALTPSEYPEA